MYMVGPYSSIGERERKKEGRGDRKEREEALFIQQKKNQL